MPRSQLTVERDISLSQWVDLETQLREFDVCFMIYLLSLADKVGDKKLSAVVQNKQSSHCRASSQTWRFSSLHFDTVICTAESNAVVTFFPHGYLL